MMPTVTDPYPSDPANGNALDAAKVKGRIDAVMNVINALDNANVVPTPGNEVVSTKVAGDAVTDTETMPTSNVAVGSLFVRIKQILTQLRLVTGKAAWYTAPATTLESANTHINAAAPHSGHLTGLTAGAGITVGTGQSPTVALTDLGVTAAKLAANSVTSAKIDSTVATAENTRVARMRGSFN